MNIIKEAESLFAGMENKACAVSSVSEGGYPRIAVMVPLKTEGMKTFYFSTGGSSNKVRHYKKNPKAGVTFWNHYNSVTLIGEISIVEDKAVKDTLWQDWMSEHFPSGGKNDPEYCVVKFTAQEGTFWINGNFETIKI